MFGLFFSALAGGKNMFTPNIYGTDGNYIDGKLNDKALFDNPYAAFSIKGIPPQHMKLPEPHVYGDMMQLIDAVQFGDRPIASAEQGRHVLEIVEAGFESMRTGRCIELRTSFTPLSLEELQDD